MKGEEHPQEHGPRASGPVSRSAGLTRSRRLGIGHHREISGLSMTRVFIVSEIRLYREGLVRFLARDGGLEPVGSAGAWPAAEQAIAQARPDVALVDLSMPEAAAAIRRLLHVFPDTRVVALGLADDEQEVPDWAEVGISGYLCRDGSLEDLVRVIGSAVRGELHCSDRLAAALLRRVGRLATRLATSSGAGQLTTREREILRLLERGLTNKQIATRLRIEVATVKNHVHNVLEKLGAQTRGEAAAKARKLGLSMIEPAGLVPATSQPHSKI